MSGGVGTPPARPGAAGEHRVAETAPAAVEFRYTQTESFPALLTELRASLLVSTYQANKLLVARAAGAGLSTLVRTFDRPMGLAVDARRLAVGTRNQIWFLRNAPDIAPRVEPAGLHDACFLPRSCHVTGDIGVHELAWAGDELWIVNTRFSCLCTLHPDYSFVPHWRPSFVTALAAEDRCHLNGLALVNGAAQIRHRPGRDRHGGRVASEQAPRRLPDRCAQRCDRRPGSVDAALAAVARRPAVGPGIRDRAACTRRSRYWPTTECSGAARLRRGLALSGPYAFVGLSKIRESSAMNGVPLADRRDELKCGVAAVDLRSGQVLAFLEFQTAVQEIFDVQLLPGLRFPEMLGFQKDTIHNTFIVPSETEKSSR